MIVKIYKPTKTSMQSARNKTKKWLVEYVDKNSEEKDSLMGWISSNYTNNQVKIFFDTKEKAIDWAKQKHYQYEVIESQDRNLIPKNYAANFAYNKKEPWTH